MDFSTFAQSAQNPITFAFWFFVNGGWIFLIGFAFYAGAYIWLSWRRGIYDSKRRFFTLTIDVPKNNEQSPKAVEQMITHLSGAHDGPKREDKWVKGRVDESFGLEIVSIGGYIQFIIHTPAMYRDLVESAVYSQYPDAEITEIEDYTKPFKGLKFPSDEWHLWGTEMIFAKDEYYPIRTYPSFEHPLSQEFKDPLSGMLENMSKLGPDEQLWFQIVITNSDVSWKEKGDRLVKKLIGSTPAPEKKSATQVLANLPLAALGALGNVATATLSSEVEDGNQYTPPSLMQHISPGERQAVEQIQIKLSKVGFFTKVRFIYIAKKYVTELKPSPADTRHDEMFGALKQFNTLDLNALRPHRRMATKVYGLFKKRRKAYRQTRLLRQYRLRGTPYTPGYFGKIMNSEELATLFHFPVMTVKAPLMKKTQSKKAEPPLTLPRM